MKGIMIYIGTSGWYYEGWRGPFYPTELQKEDFLGFYATRFPTVEINNSFYHLPLDSTLNHWRDRVPDSFIFAMKASRYITHMKRLLEPTRSTEKFWHAARILGRKLGPVLFQLPQRFSPDLKILERFLRALPDEMRCTFEFRDKKWLQPEVYALLEKHSVALCIYDYAGYQSPKETTADFVYVRLHGPEGAYQGSYTKQHLHTWVRDIERWSAEGKDVYCYFDNDQKGFAVQNARDLRSMLKDKGLRGGKKEEAYVR